MGVSVWGLTLLHTRQPGIPLSREKDQNWREADASMPTVVQQHMAWITEPAAAVPAVDSVAW